ncbi:MAG TPA: glycosyltransferase family 2 protein [Patescibacteria group bacterium]|nr:glycosyltransferase family 2 protein [Patescibacteria group bacterium]
MISIILPAFNEEKAIGGVIEEIRSVLRGCAYEYEIIVVDDGSDDATYNIALSKGGVVYRHAKNLGSGAARKTGLRHARGDIIVMLDCDATYPVKDIPRLLQHFPAFDQVIGARDKEYGALRLLRLFVKRSVTRTASFLTGTDIRDINSGFRAFKKDIAIKYIGLIPDGFSCVSTLTLIFVCKKYKVAFMPIDYYRRIGASKFMPVKDTFFFILTTLRVIIHFWLFPKA